MHMTVKDVVATSKQYVSRIFAEEGLTNLGLEEIEFDEDAGLWRVTLGFSRPWNSVRNALTSISGESSARRTYKAVTLTDANGSVVSVRRHTEGD